MKSPAFQFYPKDFLSDENVMMMTNEQVGCYIRLMSICWLEGSIPDDMNKIARICGVEKNHMGEIWLNLDVCFASSSKFPGRLVHPRLERERKKQKEYSAKKSVSGRVGASARWSATKAHGKRIANASECHSDANAIAMANDGSASASASTSPDCYKEEEVSKGAEKNPTLSEAVTFGEMRNIPKETTEGFWHHFEASGWIDKNKIPIQKWQSKLISWNNHAKSLAAESNHHRQGITKPKARPESNEIQEIINIPRL